jgi:hypothetical protein
MAPCFDVYVWIRIDDGSEVLARFIDRYVDADQPREPRFPAFVRTFVAKRPAPGDLESLAELRRDESAVEAFSIYLTAKAHEGAIITVTEEGDLVLGLSLDDPDNAPQTFVLASSLMSDLTAEFAAVGGVAGVELAPPQSRDEWRDEGLVLLREGEI